MEENAAIKCAMVRKEWVECARKMVANPVERCAFYEALFDIAFDSDSRESLPPIAAAMVEMARPALLSDRARYSERVERARAVAEARKRPRESAPADVSLQNTNTTTNTNINTKTNTTLSQESEEVGEKERYLIFGILFSKGCRDVAAEYSAWHDYYAALGWKNNKGAAIASRPSAASMWRPSGEVLGDMDNRAIWRKVFQNAKTTNVQVWTEYRGLVLEDAEGAKQVRILTAMSAETIGRFDAAFQPQLVELAGALGASSVVYSYRP